MEGTISRILSGSMVVLSGSIAHKIIAFGGSVFIARVLGDTGYGVVVVALSIYFILANLLTLGLGGGVARNYPRATTGQEKRGVLVVAFRIGLAVGTAGGIMVFVAADPIAVHVFEDPSISPLLRIIGVAFPLKVALNLSNGSFQAVKKPLIKTTITSIVQPVVRILLLVALVLTGFGAAGVVGAYTIAIGSAAIISLYYVHQHTTLFDFGRPADVAYKPLLAFSLPLVGSTILVDLMNNIDTLLIGILATSGDVGQYNVAFVLGQTTLLFLQTLGFMYVPEISELHANEQMERASMMYQAITKWVLFISVPFILTAVAFPEYIVTFIYSAEYAAATVPFLVLIIGFVTHIINGPNHSTLTAFGDTRQIFAFDAMTMLLNVVLNLSLIPQFGIVGAAMATATAYVVRNTAMTWYLYHAYGISPISRWMLLPLAPVVLVAGVLRWLVPGPSLSLVIGFTFALVAAIVFGYLSSGIEDADLLLADVLEEKTPVDLNVVRRVHSKLR